MTTSQDIYVQMSTSIINIRVDSLPISPTLGNTTVVPGNYTNSNLTIGQDGRITLASNGNSPAGIGLVIALSTVL